MKTVYVRLDDLDFAALVRGKEVVVRAVGPQHDAVHIILADIGYDRMLQWIDRAMNDKDPHSDG